MRLFIATFLDSRLISQNFNNFKTEANKVLQGKWVENDILHFTYHFLGNVDDEKIPEIKHKLEPFLTFFEEKLNIHTIKVTPNLVKPKIMIANVFNPSKKINIIRKDIQKALISTKIKYEVKKFKPHMTLVRIKDVYPDFQKFIANNTEYSFGYMKGFSINLVQSTLTNERPIYKII
jgi:2'-5' RNA ligase